MATKDKDVYDNLKNILYEDFAVAGEAAALGMGLTMLGSADPDAIEEMLKYAQDTKHEKIIRGLSLGLALLLYGKEDNADTLIE